MSTIRVDNFGPSAGGTTYSAIGIAKAWLSYDHINVTIENSYNVSSVTDNGTGVATVDFSNNFAAADYTIIGSARDINDNTAYTGIFLIGSLSGTYTTSTHQWITCNNANDPLDMSQVCVEYKGDLA